MAKKSAHETNVAKAIRTYMTELRKQLRLFKKGATPFDVEGAVNAARLEMEREISLSIYTLQQEALNDAGVILVP